MFREQAFQDPGNARQQAARGTYDPAHLNYTLGKLMIRKLRTDWLAKTAPGGAASAAGPAGAASAASAASGGSGAVAASPPTAAAAAGAAGDDKSRWHEFHDEFLSYGGPPIPLLRKQMLGDGSSPL
jgi:hypothetical protein